MTEAERIADDLKALAEYFQHWLDWQEGARAKDNLLSEPDTRFMWRPTDGIVPPTWPSRQTVANIIATLNEARELAEAQHDAHLEHKFYDR